MKIWLDDAEAPPIEERDEWTWITDPKIARDYIENDVEIEIIALDNDLGKPLEGYDILVGIEERAARGITPPKIKIITYNPVARQKMIQSIKRMREMGYTV